MKKIIILYRDDFSCDAKFHNFVVEALAGDTIYDPDRVNSIKITVADYELCEDE